MKFSSRFEVPAAPDKVVALFFDPATMRDCLPGCEELEQVDDNTFRGTLTNEIAHVKFKAGFTAVIASVEEASDGSGATTVIAVLKGEDRRLGSTIKIDARMAITMQGEDSMVEYDLEMAMWGKLGRLGESVIRRRSAEVERQFAENLAAVSAGRPIPHTGKKPAKAPALAAAGPVADESSALGSADGVMTAPAAPVASRSQDIPFIVAVAAAALAWGIVIGSRRGRRP